MTTSATSSVLNKLYSISSGQTLLGEQRLDMDQCWLTVKGHIAAVKTRDGGWIVQVPLHGATITDYGSTSGAVGMVINPSGDERHGDQSTPIPQRAVAMPRSVICTDSLIVFSAMGSDRRGSYAFKDSGRSTVDQAMPVVFVSWDVSGGPFLRPPVIGNDDITLFLRAFGIPEFAVRTDYLPSIVDFDALPASWNGKPTDAYCAGLFSRFCGDIYAGWNTDSYTPDHQWPGYGRDVASSTSLASLHLVSKASQEAKRATALGVAQVGFDQLGAFLDGRRHDVDGGHCAGRKAHIIWLGVMLGIEPLIDPAVAATVFNEDRQWFLREDGAWWNGWKAGFRYKEVDGLNGDQLKNPPSTWSSTWKWAAQGYMNPCVGTQIGTVLAMRLIGRTDLYSRALDTFVEQWMSMEAWNVQDAARIAGCRFDVGKDTSIGIADGFQAAAWRAYAG